MSEHPFGLNDNDYWGELEDTLMDFRFSRMEKGKDELLIDGPSRVPYDVRTTAPIYAYYGGRLHTLIATKFPSCAVLTGVCLETGKVVARRAVPVKGGPKPTPIEEDAGDTISSEMYRLELGYALDVPWTNGTWLVTLLMRDFVSNRLRIRFEKSQSSYRDLEVEKYLARRLQQPRAVPVWPPPALWPALPEKELPYYRRLPESPEVPAENGIVLKTERVVGLKKGVRVIIRGSFRLPAQPRDLVAAWTADQDKFTYLQPTAIVPITLVIVGSDILGPVQFDLRVPSYSEITPDAPDQTANGFFTLDLLQLEDMPAIPQTYFIYAFSGEAFTGPALCAFVEEPVGAR